ncbi:sensor histidine kinase [Microbacterium sp. SYP-A9085]|uniref:sensor histidine kinase n=1 Tax=Microbacterium sp. SYP-A9085 TaxID=2664454 RepID=UPI0020A679B2|nr:sensor histidine kinase [Microbacterium sp. SYP-A9085]
MDEDVRDAAARRFGPPWPMLPRAMGAAPFAALPDVLISRGTVSWYVGGGLSLLWLISTGQQVLDASRSPGSAALGLALIAVFALAFLAAVPLGWALPALWRIVPVLTLLTLSFTLYPWLSWGVRSVWTYVGVALGMMVLGWRTTILGIGVLAIGALWFGTMLDGLTEDDLWLPAIVFSISLMMAAFANAFATLNQLRRTQDRLEAMAAERERGRMARDIHDILGHSLTVITVKSELAARLIDADPVRAKTEVGEIEQLARGALADVRATVAGSRGVTLSGELVAALGALGAAGIDAELPRATDAVPPARRELAAWVVREGVTNVVRHSGARRCVVRLGEYVVEVADDGVGPAASKVSSTGLGGLRERVEAVGGRMSIGRSDLGGFSLTVTL